MKISLENYEQYVIDYLEGSLAPPMQVEMEVFLKEHPQIAEELQELEKLTLAIPEEIVFLNKQTLKRTHRQAHVIAFKPAWVTLLSTAAAAILLFFVWNPIQNSYDPISPVITEINSPTNEPTEKAAKKIETKSAVSTPSIEPTLENQSQPTLASNESEPTTIAKTKKPTESKTKSNQKTKEDNHQSKQIKKGIASVNNQIALKATSQIIDNTPEQTKRAIIQTVAAIAPIKANLSLNNSANDLIAGAVIEIAMTPPPTKKQTSPKQYILSRLKKNLLPEVATHNISKNTQELEVSIAIQTSNKLFNRLLKSKNQNL